MTDQLILTKSQREQKFAEWLALDMGDAFIAGIVLEKNIDGTYSQGMTRIKFNAFCAGLQSLPMVSGEPVGWNIYSPVDGELLFLEEDESSMQRRKKAGYRVVPCFEASQPLKPITEKDVTDEMVSAIENAMLAIPNVDNLGDDEFNRHGAAALFNAVIKNRSEEK